MSFTHHIRVTGETAAAQEVRSYIWGDNDWNEIGSEVHRRLIKWQKRVFKTQGRAAGDVWPGATKREQAYYKWKLAKLDDPVMDPTPELRWSSQQENLYPSLTSTDHGNHIWNVHDDGFTFGTDVPYAYKHQRGEGKTNFTGDWSYSIPQRKFLTADPSVSAFREVLSDITTIMRKQAGF